MNENTSGRRRILKLQGDIPPDTLILHSNFKILLTRDSLNNIANNISSIIGRKLTNGDVKALTNFISGLPGTNLYNLTYAQAIRTIAEKFINRNRNNLLQEQDDNAKLSGVDQDTDFATISDYNKKEVFQFTPDENVFKLSAHADRRGNSIIDRARVKGERSSPDNILPLNRDAAQKKVNTELLKAANMVQNLVDPDSVEKMISRVQSFMSAYNSVNLVRQIVQLDSRNRLPYTPTVNINSYKWNLHSASITGYLGSVRTLDTIQQIIRITAFDFWVPVNYSLISNPYAKLRMLIEEFNAQSIIASEFNDPDQSIPTEERYHFEFNVSKINGDRMLLTPAQPNFTFRKPMAVLNTMTLNFRTPFQEELFDPDSGNFTITYGNPTLFTITSPTVHLLNTGDLVYVYNSDSGNTTIDRLINIVTGHNITVVSPSQFTINVDSSTLVGTEDNILVYYGSKRLFLQLELTCLEQ
jgi:hypothetical protein